MRLWWTLPVGAVLSACTCGPINPPNLPNLPNPSNRGNPPEAVYRPTCVAEAPPCPQERPETRVASEADQRTPACPGPEEAPACHGSDCDPAVVTEIPVTGHSSPTGDFRFTPPVAAPPVCAGPAVTEQREDSRGILIPGMIAALFIGVAVGLLVSTRKKPHA